MAFSQNTAWTLKAAGSGVVHVNDGQPFMAEGDQVKLYIHPSDIMQF